MKHRAVSVSRIAASLIAALLVGAPVALAQAPSLDRAEELARFGRPEEARDVLLGWWAQSSDGAPSRDQQRALWLRAQLTVDPAEAVLDYRRLVVLYPRGEYTAQALLRLAQAAHEMGDLGAAREHVQLLRSDFRDAPARREAEAWLRDAGPAPTPPERTELPVLDQPPPGQAATVPSNADVPAADVTGEERASGFYYVQLGAFAEEDRAMVVFEQAEEEGVDARVVRVEGSQFFHVRVGRFRLRSDAAAEVERVAEQGLIAALVRDAREERVVRN
jgi:cell division septation protein DedD